MHLAVVSFVLVLAVLCPPTGTDPTPVAAAPGPVLNEFLAGPARDWNGNGSISTRDDEWVEVFNAGATVYPSAFATIGPGFA